MATTKIVAVGFILGLMAFIIVLMNFFFHSKHSNTQHQFYNLNSIIDISDDKQHSPIQTRNSNIHVKTFNRFYSIDTLSISNLKELKSKSSKELNNSTTKSPLKTILMWNAWNLRMADDPLVKARCPVSSCLFTTDMSLIQQSDVVVLHYDTLEDFPLNRRPNQRFVFYHFESPENTASALMNDPRFRYNYFNWTMTYRRDSDIFLRDYYGSLITRTSIADNIPSTRYNYNNVSYLKKLHGEQSEEAAAVVETLHSNNQTELSAIIRGKTKMVTWFVGHCSTSIRREEYVRQLSQYVSVDVFGNCTKPCPYQCDEMLRTDYKFYLAFENSWCPDYVTEKFIRPYVYQAVPVFLGGADYSQFAPPNSYIDARDFDSPKELADYLILLNKSDLLYARYFSWKKDYYVSVPDMYGWCELCRMSHDINLPVKIYADIKQWWMFGAGECQLNSTNFF